MANILWCGGEDTSFPKGSTVTVDASSGRFRSAYARCDVRSSSTTTPAYSLAFPGGAVTSCWLAAQIEHNCNLTGGTPDSLMLGLIQQSSGVKGLWIGNGSDFKSIAIYTYDGTTKTRLAQAGSDIWTGNTVVMHRIDMQLVYGTSGSVIIYVDGSPVLSFTGDMTLSGVSGLDAVAIGGQIGNSIGYSEIIVSDSDTRAIFGLQTMALTGAGTTDAWSGLYSNINGTTLSDANPVFTNTAAQDEQFNITDPSASSYSVAAVKIEARCASPAGSTATKINFGYNDGGTIAFGTGALKTLTGAFTTYEQFDQINPATGVAFVQSEMAALQLDFQSST